jgi:hypothetical protein
MAQQQQKDVGTSTDKTKSARLISDAKEWKVGKVYVMRTTDWLGNELSLEQRMLPKASLMLRCSVLLRNDVTKTLETNFKWVKKEIYTEFNLNQQLHLWRIWQMQNVWPKQTKNWTAKSELGKLEFKVRSGVMKKEKENNWKQKFGKETCDKTMKRINQD